MSHGTRKPPKAEITPAGAYPALPRDVSQQLLRALKNPETIHKASRAIEEKANLLREAVVGHVGRMEDAARSFDLDGLYGEAHEIRGLAASAGLAATGRTAAGLCRYLDGIRAAGVAAEESLVLLHLEAIARAVRAEDEANRLGEVVANELAELVDRKLAEIKKSERD